jgi:hypothetical protein
MARNILSWRRIEVFVKNSSDVVAQIVALALLKGEGDFADETRNKDNVWRRRSEPFREV